MSILVKHIPFVNEQSAFHDKQMERFGSATFRGNLHKVTGDKFRALSADLEEADKALDLGPTIIEKPLAKRTVQLSLSIEDVEGLPEELIRELSLSDADKLEFEIVNVIEEAGGLVSLDRLLINLYKRTGDIHKRQFLTQKLARMAQKNTIYYVPGKKGVYSTEQFSSEDVARLLGAVKEESVDNA